MAGRGRGRGAGKPTMSFNAEQLGLTKAECMPDPVLQPPLKFPLLEHKPTPFTVTKELSYLMELKRDYAEYMRESPNNCVPIVEKKDIERFSDRYQDLADSDKKGFDSRYDWSRMPLELKSTSAKRKKKDNGSSKKKKVKDIDINKKLQELESKEINRESEVEEEDKDDDDEEDDEDAQEDIEGEEEEVDEEMDEGTDYVNSYFDNGEDIDNDDDLDNEPIY